MYIYMYILCVCVCVSPHLEQIYYTTQFDLIKLLTYAVFPSQYVK